MGQEFSLPASPVDDPYDERPTGFAFCEDDVFWKLHQSYMEFQDDELGRMVSNMLKMVLET